MKKVYKIFSIEIKEVCIPCEDYPIQDDIWASRRWNLDHTDYCDLSGFENEWIGVDTTLDLDLITPEDLI